MAKRISLGIFIILLVCVFYYLFFKPADYIVSFTSNATSGAINQTIKLWASDLKNSKFLHQKKLSDFTHEFMFGDSIHIYNWRIKPVNDSISEVRVFILDKNHSFKNRITIPFGETTFEKRTKMMVNDIVKVLQEHKKRIKVTIHGEEELPEKYVAYVPLKSIQRQKAYFMMKQYGFLNSVLLKNKITLDGQPIVEIEKWNMENDSIQFNFCYPIKKTDSLPKIKGLKYKKIAKTKGVKATYNGNYITSDRAWYRLLEYAKKNNIEIKKNPIEIFYSNPSVGGNERDWKAEIYLPLKEKK